METDTPETDATFDRWKESPHDEDNCPWGLASRLERERNAFKAALMRIEEIYVDGCDTYEDWRAMGKIARAAFSENAAHEPQRQEGPDAI